MIVLFYILYSITFSVASAGLIWVLYLSIQSGQWLDLIFGWQKMLDGFYLKSKTEKFYIIPFKLLGGCNVCFINFMAAVLFPVSYIFSKLFFGFWVTAVSDILIVKLLAAFLWYLFYHVGFGVPFTLIVFNLIDSSKKGKIEIKTNEISFTEQTIEHDTGM